MPCLNEQQLRALAAGDATELQRAHVASCATCREALTRISQLSATFDSQRTVRREQPPEGVLAEGTEVGHYVVRRRLGAGAMGAVYAAWDVRLEREVALKVLHLEGDLLAEARHLAKLSHPNVVAVHEVRSWGDRAVLVMELVQGQTLRAWFSAPQATLATRLQVLRQCADGLAAAHAAGIIHRDFKPDNVLVDAHDRPRLLDFGLALQGAGSWGIAGSPAYMALAQLEGAPADAAADQFAWWVTVYEALTGRLPHDAPTLQGLAAARRAGVVDLSSVPRWLRAPLSRGLSNDAAARFSSMQEAARALTPPRRAPWLLAAAVTVAAAGALAWPSHSPCDELPAPEALTRRATNPHLAAVARDYADAQQRCRAAPAAEQPERAACLATVAAELDVALAAIDGVPDFTPDFAARVLKRVRPPQRCEKAPLPPRTPPEPDRDAVIESLRAQLRFDLLRTQGDFAGALALARAHAAEVADGGSPSVRVWAGLNEASGLSLTGSGGETLTRLRNLDGTEGSTLRDQTWVAVSRWLFECYSSSEQHCAVAERRARRDLALLDEPWAHAFALEVENTVGPNPPGVMALIAAWQRLPGADFDLQRAVVNELGAAVMSDDRQRQRAALALDPALVSGSVPGTALRLQLEEFVAVAEGDLARAARALDALEALPGDGPRLQSIRYSARIFALRARGDTEGELALIATAPGTIARERNQRLLAEFGALTMADPRRAQALLPQLTLIEVELQATDRATFDTYMRRYALMRDDARLLAQLSPDDGFELEHQWQLAQLQKDAAAERAVYDQARAHPDAEDAAWLLQEEALQQGRFEAVAAALPALRASCTFATLEQELRLTEAWARWELGQRAEACRLVTHATRLQSMAPRQRTRMAVLERECPFLGITAWPSQP